MQIAVITDQHIGVRNDSLAFSAYYERFYTEVFFPTLKERGIDTVFDLGDTFDRRKYVNYLTLQTSLNYYFDVLRDNNIKLHALVGNHDIFFKNTNEINALDLLLASYQNITRYKSASEIELDGTKIALVPWITPDNIEETMLQIKRTKAQICFGHLEIAGFEMYKGAIMESGLNRKVFDKFDIVATGHFHHKSKQDNIEYLGAPYQMIWSDFDDQRGFHIFDTSTRTFEYIENPLTMFNKIFYDDVNNTVDSILEQDLSQYKGSFTKVIIKQKNNPFCFDAFIDKLENMGLADLQVVEDHLNFDNDSIDTIDEAEDTMTILRKYVSQQPVADKKKLMALLEKLYTDAISIDTNDSL